MLSGITYKNSDDAPRKLMYITKLISRQNAKNVNWLLFAKYNKILQERDKLKNIKAPDI